MNQPVVLIAGPTASGKSALAMAVAERFDGIVINADSMQVYEELRIITARPDAADEARVPHRLYGVLPASARCSVADWLALARTEITAAHEAGRLPVLVITRPLTEKPGGNSAVTSVVSPGLTMMPSMLATPYPLEDA